MTRTRKFAVSILAALLLVTTAVIIFVNTPMWKSEKFRIRMGWCSYGRKNHGTYHQCQWNRDIVIDQAKAALEKANGLSPGDPVTAEDIAPFLKGLKFYSVAPGAEPGSLPPCPSGGVYSINPVGSNVTCSHPYHQWYNCMWKTDRTQP